MTVSAINATSGPFVGNGVTTAFPFTFDVGSADEVSVVADGSVVSSALYTVTLNAGGNGGTVTYAAAPTATAIYITSDPDFSQDVSFENAGAFLPETHDLVADQSARRDIYLKARQARAALVPLGETIGEYPAQADRAGYLMAFDGAGDPTTSLTAAELVALQTDVAALPGGTFNTTETFYVAAEPHGAVGDGVTADQVAVMAALGVANVRLRKGFEYAVSAPIIVPTGRHLDGNGATIKMLPGFAPVNSGGYTINACVALAPGGVDQRVSNLTIDSNKVGLGGGGAARKNGIMMCGATKFTIEGVTAKNCTGYIFFPQGVGAARPSGVIRNCHAMNGEYHYEFMQADNIELLGCTSGDGDGDIACAGFIHPVYNTHGCNRIRISDFKGIGAASHGIYALASAALAIDISFENSHLEVTGAGNGLRCEGAAGVSVESVNSNFISAGGWGILSDAPGIMTNGKFFGGRIAGKSFGGQFGTGSKVDFFGTKIVARPSAGGAATGIASGAPDTDTTTRIRLHHCEVDLVSTVGENPITGAGVTMDRETRLLLTLSPSQLGGQRVIPSSTNHVLELSDQNRTIIMSWDGNNQNLQVPQNSSVSFPIGAIIDIMNPTPNSGGRALTVIPNGAAVVNATGGVMTVAARGKARLEKTEINTWLLTGDLG